MKSQSKNIFLLYGRKNALNFQKKGFKINEKNNLIIGIFLIKINIIESYLTILTNY